MKEKSVWYLLLIFFITGFYSGCIPSKSAESVEILPSERLIKKLEANRRKIKNFVGSGSLEISTSSINNTASFKVTLLRPDSVYLNIYGPFGIDLAEILITSENFTFYDEIHNVVYKGLNDSDVLKKLFKVDITFGEVMDMFVGAVNLTSKLSREPDNYEIAYDKYILTYLDSGSERKNKYFIDVRELSITDYQLLDLSDKIIAESNYSRFKLLEGLSVPYNILIQRKDKNESIKIEYKKIEINKSNVKIRLSIPDDAEVVQL